ncbi:MAG: TolC family protein [Saprospiraceae bacterium]|nr:TolC family protein [Saprospiraceae bacterium]
MTCRSLDFIILFFLFSQISIAQDQIYDISLEEVIQIAQGDAPVALIAQTRLTNNYWRYQSFLGTFKPQLTFNASTDLDRTIDAITLPDGSDVFINRSLMSTRTGIRLGQQIPQTGGFIYAGTNLRRIDLFGDVTKNKSYLSAPFSLGFIQPIFQFNRAKWEQKVQGLQYDESRKQYVEETEKIAYDAVDLFFTLYTAQLNLAETRRQKTYADSLYQISQGRFEVGRIAETDLLQIELRAKNAEAEEANQLLLYQSANEALRNFLGLSGSVVFNLLDPPILEDYLIDVDQALSLARQYRSITTSFQRQMTEAEMDLDEANKGSGLSLNLDGYFGLSQTSEELRNAYRDPIDQERIGLTLEVPIADWGLSRARKEIAKSNLDLTRRTIEQDNINFERQVILRVQQFDLKRLQLDLAKRAFEVAEKRISIAKNRYQIGKIAVTDLNIALNEHESTRSAYYQSLWALWTAHYEIRNLTLYDFIKQKPLRNDADLEKW